MSSDLRHKKILLESLTINPCSPEGFSQTYFPKGVVTTPSGLSILLGHITIDLLPVYNYGYLLSIDTKINTNHLCMTSL